MQKINPFLWFDGQAEQAMEFYCTVFKNSKKGSLLRYGKDGPLPEGTVLTASFELEGQTFTALNGGPQYSFTPAISFVVNCTTQEEVDDLWEKLTADGGKEMACGWLTDKFGVSWQIVPEKMLQLLQDKDPQKAQRVMAAMMKMIKLDLAVLQAAYDNE